MNNISHINTRRLSVLIMKGTVSDRFEIEESSWSWELSSAIVDFLKMIPAEDDTIDIEKILFDCLSDRVLLFCNRYGIVRSVLVRFVWK